MGLLYWRTIFGVWEPGVLFFLLGVWWRLTGPGGVVYLLAPMTHRPLYPSSSYLGAFSRSDHAGSP